MGLYQHNAFQPHDVEYTGLIPTLRGLRVHMQECFTCEEPVPVQLAAEQQVRLSSDPPAADFIRIQSLEVDMDIPSAVVQSGGESPREDQDHHDECVLCSGLSGLSSRSPMVARSHH